MILFCREIDWKLFAKVHIKHERSWNEKYKKERFDPYKAILIFDVLRQKSIHFTLESFSPVKLNIYNKYSVCFGKIHNKLLPHTWWIFFLVKMLENIFPEKRKMFVTTHWILKGFVIVQDSWQNAVKLAKVKILKK